MDAKHTPGPWQVITYNANAHRCHDQIRGRGFFSTESAAKAFAASYEGFGAEVIVRPYPHPIRKATGA